MTAYQDAVAACRAFRAQGGKVVILTNAPRPRAVVGGQLARFNLPDDCYDTIATSGNSARLALFDGAVGSKVYYIGEETDLCFFEPLKIVKDPLTITRVPLEQAEGLVVASVPGRDKPEDWRGQLLYAKTKELKLLCANPDVVVDRGDKREYAAGAIAELYTEMGGESLYFGKPLPAIYDLARRRLAEIADISDDRIICIGDGITTDIRGAIGEGLDSIFITGGLAAAETKTAQQPDPQALDAYLSEQEMSPTYAMGYLR